MDLSFLDIRTKKLRYLIKMKKMPINYLKFQMNI